MHCVLVSPLLLHGVQPGYVNCNGTDRIEDREDESEGKFKSIFIFFLARLVSLGRTRKEKEKTVKETVVTKTQFNTKQNTSAKFTTKATTHALSHAHLFSRLACRWTLYANSTPHLSRLSRLSLALPPANSGLSWGTNRGRVFERVHAVPPTTINIPSFKNVYRWIKNASWDFKNVYLEYTRLPEIAVRHCVFMLHILEKLCIQGVSGTMG